jgi:protein-ribulosamine 3-kinase
MLPEHVREEIRSIGEIRDAAAVGGGCISPAFHVWLAGGREVFVKLAPRNAPAAILAEEARSLEILRSAGPVRVPAVIARGEQWLALEWLEPARGTRVQWAKLGNALALLHRVHNDTFGWQSDNFIGTLPQTNHPAAAWPEFWREQRIARQLERARDRLGAAAVRDCETLMLQFEELLRAGDEEGASLLHGDLWSGNVHMSARGAAVIDPASYYGHREVDLAMAALFGGFPPEFFDAYEAEWPLLPGSERRRHIYQLYYLLVHVNLFGGGYVAGTAAAIRNALD